MHYQLTIIDSTVKVYLKISQYFRKIQLIYSNFSVIQEYAKNPGKNWKSKDAAIYLVTSLAAKAQTQKVGIHQIQMGISIIITVLKMKCRYVSL